MNGKAVRGQTSRILGAEFIRFRQTIARPSGKRRTLLVVSWWDLDILRSLRFDSCDFRECSVRGCWVDVDSAWRRRALAHVYLRAASATDPVESYGSAARAAENCRRAEFRQQEIPNASRRSRPSAIAARAAIASRLESRRRGDRTSRRSICRCGWRSPIDFARLGAHDEEQRPSPQIAQLICWKTSAAPSDSGRTAAASPGRSRGAGALLKAEDPRVRLSARGPWAASTRPDDCRPSLGPNPASGN